MPLITETQAVVFMLLAFGAGLLVGFAFACWMPPKTVEDRMPVRYSKCNFEPVGGFRCYPSFGDADSIEHGEPEL